MASPSNVYMLQAKQLHRPKQKQAQSFFRALWECHRLPRVLISCWLSPFLILLRHAFSNRYAPAHKRLPLSLEARFTWRLSG